MKYQDVPDRLMRDLGFDVDTYEAATFVKDNLLEMPDNVFRDYNDTALDTHIHNLIETFGMDLVIERIVERMQK